MKRASDSFHLLLGDRWPLPPRTNLIWSGNPPTLRLKPVQARVPRPDAEGRRGSAADSQGRIYWISPDGAGIWVQHPDGGKARFWPAGTPVRDGAADPDGSPFRPRHRPAGPPLLVGLAITLTDWLVAGMVGEPALLAFDLAAGSPPMRFAWPAGLVLTDLAPAPDGGLLLLEGGETPRLWRLDPNLRIAGPPAILPPGSEPLAVEPLPDGSWLLLCADEVRRWRDGQPLPGSLSLARPDEILGEEGRIIPYDIAFDPQTAILYAATRREAQCFAWRLDLQADRFGGDPLALFLPTPGSRGWGLLAAAGRIWHDAGTGWAPLRERPYTRYLTEGTCRTPVLDGREQECVWHRVLLDATIPPGTAILIESRAANEQRLLSRMAWRQEPEPIRRPVWLDRPLFQNDPAPDAATGTWELLLQEARGRFLELHITLRGSRTATPELRGLRVWYPRFSYLTHHLPAVYHNDSTAASFLERYLANAQGVLTAVEAQLERSHLLFNPETAPAEYLGWLAGWFGLALGETWAESRSRLFIRHAMQFFQFRGTLPGLVWALRLALDPHPTEAIFTSDLTPHTVSAVSARTARPAFRIAENPREEPHTFVVYVDEEQVDFAVARQMIEVVLDLSKPAHTRSSVLPMQTRLAVAETRLGINSVLAAGPARLPAAVLGQACLSSALLSTGSSDGAPPRITVGQDRLEPAGRGNPDDDREESTHGKG